MSIAWVMGVARHKVIDHYRKAARDERRLMLLAVAGDDVDDSLALAGQDPARIVQAFGFARRTVAAQLATLVGPPVARANARTAT